MMSSMSNVLTGSATIGIEEASELLGVSRDLGYRTVKKTGELNGIPVIRVGRLLRLPRRPFLESLGLADASK